MLFSRSLKLAVLGLGLTFVVAGCDRQSADKAQQPESSASAGEAVPGALDRSHKGSQLPDLTLSDAAGKTLKFTSLKGKPVLINLWATWCAPCVAELPQLDKLAAGGHLRVVTVSQDSDGDKGVVAGFLTSHGIKTLEPWLDPAMDVSTQYNATTLPSSILYDSQGREVWRVTGPRDWENAETVAALAEAK